MLIKDIKMKPQSQVFLGKSEREMSLFFPPFKTCFKYPKWFSEYYRFNLNNLRN